jgi:hypothetical protein
VAGFASLNNFPIKGAHTDAKVVKLDKSTKTWSVVGDRIASGNTKGSQPVKPALTTNQTGDGQTLYGVTPYDFATIYNLKPLWDAGLDGTGQQIAIIAESDISTADVDQFRSAFGLPATQLNIIHNGDAPGFGSDQDEASIDVEWAGAVAKNATVDLVVSASTAASAGVCLSMTYAVDNLIAPVLSESYGVCVNPGSLTFTPGQSGTATIVVATTPPNSSYQARQNRPSTPWAQGAGGVAIAALGLFLSPRRRALSRLSLSLIAMLSVAAAIGLAGCGSGKPSAPPPSTPQYAGTPAGSYPLTVSLTNGTTTVTQTIALQVTAAN